MLGETYGRSGKENMHLSRSDFFYKTRSLLIESERFAQTR